MFFVRSQVRHTGFELTQADDALLLAPQAARFQNTQPLAYNPRRSPAQFSYQNCEPLPRSVIQPGLNCDSHAPIVLQASVCMTYKFAGSCGSLADPYLPASCSRAGLGRVGVQELSERTGVNKTATRPAEHSGCSSVDA